jgi:D-hydroxyproline dehydrogenase subunit alpha
MNSDPAITFDGQRVPLRPGQSIGAALVSAGIRSWRTTRKDGSQRGMFCGIGICYDCLVTVDDVSNQRACLTPARLGMQVRSSLPAELVEARPFDRLRAAPSTGSGRRPSTSSGRNWAPVDLAVVGAGPAGLAAAATAAEAGLSVVVIDSNSQSGGQYWRHRDETSTDAPPTGQHDVKTYTRLRQRFDAARDNGRLRYLPDTQIWFIETPSSSAVDSAGASAASDHLFVLRTTGFSDVGPQPPEPRLVRAAALILCPGGHDRQLPIPGWDLPGVMAAGGVQAMLKGYGTLSGTRAVVAGTGPFLLPVATGLAAAGAEVVGICEAGAVMSWLPQLRGALQVPSKGIEAAAYAARLARHRIPFWTLSAVSSINGADQVRSVTIVKIDSHGSVKAGTSREIGVDLVALGWGFTPSLELVTAVGGATRVDVDGSLVAVVDDRQRTTVLGVYAAGEVTGVGGASLAVLEGELAALTVAHDSGLRDDANRCRRLQRAIARARAFAAAMHRAHRVPSRWEEWLTTSTVVCRCEEVTYGEIRYACDELGAEDARTVKLMSRPGMGWCQGRVCGFATAKIAASAGQTPTADALRSIVKRPLCSPIALRELAELADLDAPANVTRGQHVQMSPTVKPVGNAYTSSRPANAP